MKSGNNVFNKAFPAALIPFVAPFASFAAEGTGRVSDYYNFKCKLIFIFCNDETYF
jgi:hypothetical protein